MAGRERVRTMLDAGLSHEEIAAQLHVSPGLVHLVATGMPADGSDVPSATAHDRPGFLASSQHLSSPEPAGNPTTSRSVTEWMRGRAAADRQMQDAARGAAKAPGDAQEREG